MKVVHAALLAGLALLATAWVSAGDPPPDGVLAQPTLLPVPASVTNQCRLAQIKSTVAVLCPTVLPQASIAAPGTPADAPPPGVKNARAKFVERGGLDVRLTFKYGLDVVAGSGRSATLGAWRNHPCCYLHFEVFTRTHRPFHLIGGRPLVLAGHSGTYLPAVGPDMACGRADRPFWCNHVAFVWRQNGVSYAATLRTFGAGTTELLGRLIAGLQPAPRA